MFLEQLVADAEVIIANQSPDMYDWRPVKWQVDIDQGGGLVAHIPLVGDGARGDRGKTTLVPDRTRQGTAPPPVLLADTARYAYGIPSDDPKAAARHEWFTALHERAAADLPDARIDAVVRHLGRWHSGEFELPVDMSPDDRVVFTVDGRALVDRPDVRSWWALNWDGPAKDPGSSDVVGLCSVCGETRAIGEYVPFKLKGLPNGQSAGTTLVGMNDSAFESYGFPRGVGARVCSECGQTLMKALNVLLADEGHRMIMGDLVYVYWASGAAGVDLFGMISRPDPQEVGALLTSVGDGKVRAVDASMYNIAALSAASARAALRDWMRVDGDRLDRSLAHWFELQRMVDAWGGPGEPLGCWRLAAAAYRDARGEMTSDVPRALMRTALQGSPLPSSLLPRVIQRCRADHDPKSRERPVTRERAVLIRALLASRNGWRVRYMTELEPNEPDPAYVSGRVMALLEDVQQAALGKVGATVVDKYYGAASATPASVLGRLVGDAQHHLAKIRRDREGLYVTLQRRLEDVLSQVDAFPTALALEKQGLFALGYYHQRADLRASRKGVGEAVARENEE